MIRYGFLGSSLVRSSINRDTLVQRQSRALSPVSRNSIQPRDSAGDGFRSFIAPNKTLLRPQRCAWKFVEPLLSFILFSRGDRISRTTEFFLLRLRSVFLRSTRKGTRRAPAALPPLSRTRGKKKKKRSGRSTRRPILPRAEIKSNVQRPFPIPFPFFSFPDPSHFCPASPLPLSLSSPLLQNSCTLGQIARIRLHRYTAK